MLNNDERHRMAAYLRQRAHDSSLMVEQLKKLPHMAVLIARETNEAVACRIVADMLEKIESVEVSK